MTRKSIFSISALTLGLALLFAVSARTSTSAAATIPGDDPLNLAVGSVEGTVNLPATLPQGVSLPCSSLKVGLYRYTDGNPIGAVNGPSVTPQSAGPGKCSYKLSTFTGSWIVSVGDSLPNWDLITQISPYSGVMITKGQTATRNITINRVVPYKLN